jgi:tetrathionate reductase subunit B
MNHDNVHSAPLVEEPDMSAPDKQVASRRNFMQKIFGGAAAAAVVSAAAATAPEKKDPPKKHNAMLIDTRRCIGCHSCSVACKAEFDVPLGVTRSWVEYTEKGTFPNVSRNFLPRLCNHCRHPQCVDVCPTGATYKREQDGIVVVDSGLCIGCKYCILACPYDARFLNPVTGVADKCDFCIHRVSKGLLPSCVNSCVGGARIFGDISDPSSEISQLVATHPTTVLRPGMGTEPQVYYIGADHSDEHENKTGWSEVRITTHRTPSERR